MFVPHPVHTCSRMSPASPKSEQFYLHPFYLSTLLADAHSLLVESFKEVYGSRQLLIVGRRGGMAAVKEGQSIMGGIQILYRINIPYMAFVIV